MTAETPRKKSPFRYLFYLVALCAIVFVAWLYFWPAGKRNAWDFVPADAIYIAESDDPIEDWKSFSGSAIWNHLRKHPYFGYIDSSAAYLDSLVKSNDKLLSIAGDRTLLISAHPIKKGSDYDFLYLLDLKKGAKVSFFKDLILGALSQTGIRYSTQQSAAGEITVVPAGEGEKLYFAFSDNILLASYTADLVEAGLKQGQSPRFSTEPRFTSIKKSIGSKGTFRLYFNYEKLGVLGRIYMGEENETVRDLSQNLDYSALALELENDMGRLSGPTLTDPKKVSMLNALLHVKGSGIKAQKVLPSTTSFFLHMGFKDFHRFLTETEHVLQQDDASWKEYQNAREKAEGFLNISFEDDLFSWIGNEISLALIPVDSMGKHQAYAAVFHCGDPARAEEGLDHIQRQIKRKTPVKFKEEEYMGYQVKFMEMKSFFKLFLGSFFKKFDKPHFVQMGEFVVFSNDTAALHRSIEHFVAGTTLEMDEAFQDFSEEFPSSPNALVMIRTAQIFPYLQTMMEEKAWVRMKKNRSWYLSYPFLGMSLQSDGEQFDTRVLLGFHPQ